MDSPTYRLHGDDFTADQIAHWFEEERDASVELSGVDFPFYYRGLNDLHAWDRIEGRLGTVLAIGCGNGKELEQIAARVDRFLAVEPAREWWGGNIGSVETEYREPIPSGAIDLPDDCIDNAVCFGVLHHIPNVSAVLGEIARVLKPGGRLFLREPISSMGDATSPRDGLTKNERGLPLPWLRHTTRALGLQSEYEAPCIFPVTAIIATRLGVEGPFNRHWIATLDALACRLLAWNIRYERPSLFSKIAPGDVAMILRKP